MEQLMYDKICKLRTIPILLLFFISIITPSCTLKQSLFIDKNAAGSVSFELTLAPFFIEVTQQLSELFPVDSESLNSDTGPFNLIKLRDDLSKGKGVIIRQLETSADNVLEGSLVFDDITTALNGDGKKNIQDVFNFVSENNIHTLSVLLNYTTVGQLLSANPSMNSALMESFGPLSNKGLSDEEYLEMMQFALGDDSREGIRESFVLLDIDVDGEIVSQKGGTIIDNNTIRFEIPLLRILILDDPQFFSVSFSE
jgi:hypothetical protein